MLEWSLVGLFAVGMGAWFFLRRLFVGNWYTWWRVLVLSVLVGSSARAQMVGNEDWVFEIRAGHAPITGHNYALKFFPTQELANAAIGTDTGAVASGVYRSSSPRVLVPLWIKSDVRVDLEIAFARSGEKLITYLKQNGDATTAGLSGGYSWISESQKTHPGWVQSTTVDNGIVFEGTTTFSHTHFPWVNVPVYTYSSMTGWSTSTYASSVILIVKKIGSRSDPALGGDADPGATTQPTTQPSTQPVSEGKPVDLMGWVFGVVSKWADDLEEAVHNPGSGEGSPPDPLAEAAPIIDIFKRGKIEWEASEGQSVTHALHVLQTQWEMDLEIDAGPVMFDVGQWLETSFVWVDGLIKAPNIFRWFNFFRNFLVMLIVLGGLWTMGFMAMVSFGVIKLTHEVG